MQLPETAAAVSARFGRYNLNKPFKTINEQIEILNKRGVSTDNHTARILLREGYYAVVNGGMRDCQK